MKSTGLGHLFQRSKNAKGEPCGNYYLQYNIHGKRKIICLGTDNENEAEKQRKAMLGEALQLNTKQKVIVHVAENRKLISSVKTPINEVWDSFKTRQHINDDTKGTASNYKRCWGRFCVWIGANHRTTDRINLITPDLAEEYFASLWKSGISPGTYNYHLHSLKHIYKIVRKDADNPFAEIKKKVLEEAGRKAFTRDQVEAMLASFDNPALDVADRDEMRLMFYLGANLGARLVDCALMRTDSINMRQRSISYVPIKTRRTIKRTDHGRLTVPIGDEGFYKLLQDYVGRRIEIGEYLLPSVSKRYLKNKDGVTNECLKVMKFCGIRELKDRKPKAERKTHASMTAHRVNEKVEYGFHSFRHYVGTTLAEKGVPIKTISEILGDSIKTAAKYYIHVSDDEKKRAMDKLKVDETESEAPSKLDEHTIEALSILKKANDKDISASLKEILLKSLHTH